MRKNIGIICELYSLADAVEYRGVSEKFWNDYMKKFPESRADILIIKSIIKGTPAEKILHVGDIILSVDSIAVGASLQTFDLAINASKKDHVSLEIIRNGEFKKFEIETYDMEKYKIRDFIDFSSTFFFQTDEAYSSRTGICLGELTFYRSQNSTTFGRMLNIAVQNGNLVKAPKLIKIKTCMIHQVNSSLNRLIIS